MTTYLSSLVIPVILFANCIYSSLKLRTYLRTGVARRWWLAPEYERAKHPIGYWFEVAFMGAVLVACVALLGFISVQAAINPVCLDCTPRAIAAP